MATPLTIFNTNDLLYSYLLASRYRSPWIYEPSNAFLREPDLWEIVRNDADILSCIQRRSQGVVRPWRIVPPPHATSKFVAKASGEATKRTAAICYEAFGYIDRFEASRRVLAEAFFLGRRYARIEWDEVYTSLDSTPEMLWYLPVKLKDVDRRRFHWVPEWSDGPDGKSLKTAIHMEMFDTNEWTWKRLSPDERRSYVEYIWEDTEDRLGHGRGALEALFFTHYFKSGTLKKLMEGVDRYANGFLKAKLDSLRSASTDLTNEELTSRMKSLAQKIRSEHIAVLGEGDDLELLETTGQGLRIALDLVRFFNESAERLANGSVRPAGHSVDGTGARAAAQVEGETSEAFYQSAREDLDSVIDRDLLGGFLYFNEANFQQLGLSRAKRPKFISQQIRKQDPKTRVEVLNASKVPILRSEYYEALEATPPGPDDDTIEPAAHDVDMETPSYGIREKVLGKPREGEPPKKDANVA